MSTWLELSEETRILNIEHITSIMPAANGDVIIKMADGERITIHLAYSALKDFLKPKVL